MSSCWISPLGKALLFVLAIGVIGCGSEDGLYYQDVLSDEPEVNLVGKTGKLRFNLQFTNEESVDLDLFVLEPNGKLINFEDPASASGGELDVDCHCAACARGPNENITWPNSDPTPGVYKVWVSYFASCDPSLDELPDGVSSEYTLRILRDDQVVETYRGSLESGKTEIYVHQE